MSFARPLAVAFLASALFSSAQESESASETVHLDDYLVETNPATFRLKAPAVTHQVLGSDLQALNLPETGDALQHLPNLFIRKRFIGDKNALTSIRGTSNRQPGRTLVLADGIPLSNFLGTGFGNSPRWFLVAPQEIEKIAVTYGPYSALYAGNSIGGTILFTTRLPAEPTADVHAQWFSQNYSEYGTHRDFVGRSGHVSVGGRQGKLQWFVLGNRLENDSHPMSFATVNRSLTSAGGTGGLVTNGALADTDFAGAARIIYGSTGPTAAVHNLLKWKLGYELAPDLHLRYTGIHWSNTEDNLAPETYLRDAAGNAVWSGRVEMAGRTYTLPANAFTLSRRSQADLINALTLAHEPEEGLAATLTLSAYDVLKDKTYASTGSYPVAATSGAGQATVIGRTGWVTADAWFGWREKHGWLSAHSPAWGYHFDHYFTRQAQWAMTDWTNPVSRTALNNGTGGDTRTHALFLQDEWAVAPHWSVTPGLRWETWSADKGFRERDLVAGRVRTAYSDRSEDAVSPKFALTWKPSPAWRARLSLARAVRFPTVGELFQGSLSTSGSLTQNDPNLQPEDDFAKDLTLERTLGDGTARTSIFEEDVRDALVNQSTLRPDGTSFTGVQNVKRVRTRGAEVAWQQRGWLHPSLSLDASASFTDSIIRSNPGLAASEGKRFPRIPKWQLKATLAWTAREWLSLSGSTRYSSYQYNTLDNSDPHGGYGGTDAFWVSDAKASFTLARGVRLSVGVDNLTGEKYHVFHPMPQRTWFVEAGWRY